MKTYFMAWESDNKRGHSIFDFDDDVPPREVLAEMINTVYKEASENEQEISGVVSAKQFNIVA